MRKNVKVMLVFFLIFYSCKSPQKITHKAEMAEFAKHFKVLDSAILAVYPDTVVYGCFSHVLFMEGKTRIEASGPGTALGRLYFVRSDLKKWHEWYDKKYNQ